jgi:hypothetical protein
LMQIYNAVFTPVFLFTICFAISLFQEEASLKFFRFWLQIQKSGFDSRPYKIFWEVGDLERGPLSLVRTTEELLEWKSSGSGLEHPRLTAVGILCADHATTSTCKGWH